MSYKKISVALGLVAAFLAGCVMQGAVREALIVPPARAGTNPTHWEYQCLEANNQITQSSNRLGAEGWELVAAAGAGWGNQPFVDHTLVWCFKRPLE